MRIYLDNCCYNRPYDDQTSLKIRLETQAKLHIQDGVLRKKYDLIWSSTLDYENFHNPYTIHRNSIFAWRRIAIKIQTATNDVIELAKSIMQIGVKNKDALHLASAIVADSDVFITVDKKLLHAQVSRIKIIDPIRFLDYEET